MLAAPTLRTLMRRTAAWGTLACCPCAAWAQTTDTLVARELAPGVAYRQFIDRAGPWRVNLVRVNLRVAAVQFRPARAGGALRGREKTTAIAGRAAESGAVVLAAINADFFQLESGENENNQVINGEWWKGLKITDSPYDTYDNVHVQFGVDSDGHPLMDRFILDGRFWARGHNDPHRHGEQPAVGPL